MMRISLCLLLFLAACSSEEDIARYTLPAVPVDARQSIGARTVEIRTISLPLYAEAEEIAVRAEDGSLRATGDILWADEPDRALTALVARSLADATGATVAAEPWPLERFPDMRIEVRIDELAAPLAGPLHVAGAWFAARPGRDGADRSGRFDFMVPVAEPGYLALAEAHAIAARDIALAIAEGAR